MVEFAFRNDASAYFPEATRVGFFPGASLGWVVSKESFMDNVNFIHRLKLRASATQLGNDQANSFAFIEGFGIRSINGGGFADLGINGYALENGYQTAIFSTGIANPGITWQRANLYNLGLEASFLKGKLGLEFEAFYRERFDLLAVDTQGVQIPNTTGALQPLRNLESRNNRGFEAIVNYKDKVGNVGLNVSANASWSREKYDFNIEPEDLGDEDLNRINLLSGQWVNRTFGYQFDGFFTQEDIDNNTLDYDGQNGQLQPGDIKIKDTNGDGIIDNRDRVVIGRNGTPEIIFGLNTQLTWKNFDFTMFWQGAANFNQNIQANERGLEIQTSGTRTPFKYVTDRVWTEENQGVGAEFPRDITGPTNNLTLDKYYLDSKYVRLKNLVIGYTLPKEVTRKIGGNNIRIFYEWY